MGTYHHGNLKHDLLEACIHILNEQGTGALSLRAVAAECGVSHAAPYNHFVDKEALLQAADQYVVQLLTAALAQELGACQYQHDELVSYGRAYVLFFLKHPQYYRLLFFRSSTRTWRTELAENGALQSNFKPFLLFCETAGRVMNAVELPPRLHAGRILEMWTAIQGVTTLFVLEGFAAHYGEATDELLLGLLRSRLHIHRKG